MKNIIKKFIRNDLDIKILRLTLILVFVIFGTYKWFAFETAALQPIFTQTWLKILPSIFGYYGATYYLGVVEAITFLTLIIGYVRPVIGVVGDLLVILTGITTLSLLPQLGPDSFIIKDLLLVGGGTVLLKYDLTSVYKV